MNNPVEIDRIENVFPEIVPEGELWYPYAMVDKSKGVIVGWEVKKITEEIDEIHTRRHGYYRGNMDFMMSAEAGGNWTGGGRYRRLHGPFHAE
ncbi:MAG: hypothetical protein MZV63_49030 [Marinilabiliales bacterium]|nr:hypothetical protein [Marinilabiliales bacterium]